MFCVLNNRKLASVLCDGVICRIKSGHCHQPRHYQFQKKPPCVVVDILSWSAGAIDPRCYHGAMPEAEEHPYHIQAVYDLQADYSPAHFRRAVGEYRKVVAQLVADDDRSDQQIARVNIL